EMRPTNNPSSALELSYLLAFRGLTEPLVRLFQRDLAKLPRDQQQFWIATAELAEDRPRGAIDRLEKLRDQTQDAILQRAIARRLTQAVDFSPPHLSPSSEALLARVIGEMRGRAESAATRGTPAVWAFIVLNLGMFGLELYFGGS